MRIVLRMGSLFALAVALCCSAARAQEITKAEKEKAMQYLESTRKGVAEATKGLSDAQLNFKAAPDKWSVAEVVEHIAAAEDYLRGLVTEQVMKAPAAPDRDVKKIDEMVLAAIPDRSHKAQAPEPLKPTNRFGSAEGSLKHFEESRMKTEEFLYGATELRAHAVDSPLGQKLDAYEWLLFIAAHSERHTKQILEVRADPNFPKK